MPAQQPQALRSHREVLAEVGTGLALKLLCPQDGTGRIVLGLDETGKVHSLPCERCRRGTPEEYEQDLRNLIRENVAEFKLVAVAIISVFRMEPPLPDGSTRVLHMEVDEAVSSEPPTTKMMPIQLRDGQVTIGPPTWVEGRRFAFE